MSKQIYTMVAKSVNKDGKIVQFMLISNQYKFVSVDEAKLIQMIKSPDVDVVNLEIKDGKIHSINGDLNKYTTFNCEGKVEGKARGVILNRVEKNNELVGYVVYMHTGELKELSVKDTATLAENQLISNGKIRQTAKGNIVSAIGGNYPLREIKIEESPAGKIDIKFMYAATTIGSGKEYFGAIITGTSASQMAKVTRVLMKSNEEVASAVTKVLGKSSAESLKVRRFGANGVYGVFDIKEMHELITKSKANVSVINNQDIVLSVLKANGDETIVKLDNQNFTMKSQNGETSEEMGKLMHHIQRILELA